MEFKLIFSKATNKYFLIVPINFDPDVLPKLRNAFAKSKRYSEEKINCITSRTKQS